MNRRTFIKSLGYASSITALHGVPGISAKNTNASRTAAMDNRKSLQKTYRAAAIGSTGHGNFGHGLDLVFRDLPGVQFVAVADDNPDGLKKAGQRNDVANLYSDYREMLVKENIDIVSVAMRHSELHEKIAIDCAKAGIHIFCEKPTAPDLAAADRMHDACVKIGVKMAVALQNRASLAVHKAKKMIEEGRIGKILTMRGFGKEDHRGGGEDLMVLGFHILDLMCFFAGRPKWTFAHAMQDGREMVKTDARPGDEPNGPVAGDWLTAMYGFENGVHGTFESHRALEGTRDRFYLEIHGSEGIIAMRSLRDVVWFEGPVFNPANPHQWQIISTPEWDTIENKMHWCNQQIVLDLLQAAEEDREPLASDLDALWSLEMILSVYTSHLRKERISLPLKNREHPLGSATTG